MPGDRVVYTVLVTNTGTIDIAGMTISDTIPVDTTYVPNSAATNGNTLSISNTIVAGRDPLQPGQVFSLTFAVIVNPTPVGLEIDNLAIVRAPSIDPPDPFVRLLLDSNGNGIPDIIENAPGFTQFYLPIMLQDFGD
jgi:uncharacterized repeat protein (TIGR01451 family)